ncbi:hypothetical protein BU25DRAFT_469511 [Macroventuria anomochaeta]|uniref:Uncharacterized protein n=1 Tax=Macroventuria anomochaeta TaxID=301207 RepID=A0ACB6RZ86_9PLEO|nr:uncharacterized protein BU25DRAFT_469511 [Macroventuria anomochaeta]KAF2627094.1 hypothetical protein BU25DRAFT_469511 [Macroventuria anomochaeta]
MHLLHITFLLSLSLSSLTLASGTCTSTNTLSWPPVGNCAIPGKFDTIVQNCRACCMNNANCFQTCLKAGGLRRRGAIGEQSFGISRDTGELRSRAVALSCEVNEGCYKYTDGGLLCLNLGTGLYHDDVGGNGDYYSGNYTGPDGKVQTGTSTATATSSSRSSSVTSQGTKSTAPVQATSAGAASASASSAAASAISPGGGDGFRRGANVGLIYNAMIVYGKQEFRSVFDTNCGTEFISWSQWRTRARTAAARTVLTDPRNASLKEGIRVVNGRIQFARDHINRLIQSVKAMYMDLGVSKGDLIRLLHQTLDANDPSNEGHVHIRLAVSRGLKSTPYQNPKVNIGLPVIVIIPEVKTVDPSSKSRGLQLGTT